MTEMKHCRKCGCDKPADRENWYFKKSGTPNAPCRTCRRELMRSISAEPDYQARKRERYHKDPKYKVRRRERDRERYRADPEYRARKYESQQSQKCKARKKDYQREYQRQRRSNDPDYKAKSNEHSRNWQKRHSTKPEYKSRKNNRNREYSKRPEVMARKREREREYVRERRLTDLKFRLDHNVRTAVAKSLRRVGARKTDSKSKFLDWTVGDLIKHLEQLFEFGMSFENYGDEWQIDHIIPLSAVNYESEHDPLFKMVWSLSNLAPLWAKDNNEKLAQIHWQLPDTYKNPKLRELYEDRDYALAIFG